MGGFIVTSKTPIALSGGAQITADPKSNVKLPDGESPVALTFDWPLDKWLPVERGWLSPDGRRYAYADTHGQVRVVNAADGSEQTLTAPGTWKVVGMDGTTVYAATADGTQPAGGRGLSALPIAGSAPRTLATTGAWAGVGQGFAWSVGVQGAVVPTLLTAAGLPPGNVLRRLDLATGAVDTWLTRPDAAFRLLGVDPQGHPILVAGTDQAGVRLWTVPAVATPQQVGGGTVIPDAEGDSHGVWFLEAMTTGVYLSSAGGGSQPLATWGGAGAIRLAGACGPVTSGG